MGRTVYLVGGYDGTTYEPSVLATTDGTHFTTVANLPVPVRYPAVVALGGHVFSFGGQTGSGAGSAVTATTAIQEIDPATHSVSVVGTLPQALYGAAAFVIDGHIYLAGGQTGGGQTLTQIYEFDQRTHRVADAGLLPQAVAFGGLRHRRHRASCRRVPRGRRGGPAVGHRPGRRGEAARWQA